MNNYSMVLIGYKLLGQLRTIRSQTMRLSTIVLMLGFACLIVGMFGQNFGIHEHAFQVLMPTLALACLLFSLSVIYGIWIPTHDLILNLLKGKDFSIISFEKFEIPDQHLSATLDVSTPPPRKNLN